MPNRRTTGNDAEGQGPFKTLVIRGAILIDGTGAPPQGPVDIIIENNRIKAVRSAGTPFMPLRPNREPRQADLEIDATGMYVLPGFVYNHVHAGGAPKNPEAEYPYKLWLAHGVTTVRGVPMAANDITVNTPEAAREWVRWAASNGIDSLKLGAHRPEIMAALLDYRLYDPDGDGKTLA